ncbi:MAG: YaiO family outer membrane beta-barrel protein [Deltaproteobacteria bacterium]|nr:YaiO family outer membrane beta-barrel protein [Deltaproteobacteria bacterium]
MRRDEVQGHRRGLPLLRSVGICFYLILALLAALVTAHAQTVADILARARALEAAKQYEQATVAYREYLAARPEDDEVRAALARLLSWQGHYGEAAALYRDILTRKPLDLDLRVALARVLSWQKRFAEARALYEGVLEQDAKNLEAKRGLADTLYGSGDYAGALRVYEEILATGKDPEVAKRMEAVRAELARASSPSLPYRDYFKYGYGHYTYSNGISDERAWLLEAAKSFGSRTVIARIEPLTRFGRHDTLLSAEVDSPLWSRAWGYLAGGATVHPDFSPKVYLGGELFQNLAVLHPALSFLEPSFGFRWLSFRDTKVEVLIPGLVIHLPRDVWLTERLYYVPDTGTVAISSELTWRVHDRLRLFGGATFGHTAERLGARQDFISVTSRAFRAGLTFPIAQRISAETAGYYEDRKTLYIRRGGNFSLIFHW